VDYPLDIKMPEIKREINGVNTVLDEWIDCIFAGLAM